MAEFYEHARGHQRTLHQKENMYKKEDALKKGSFAEEM